MKTIEIKGFLRTELGKKSTKLLRKEGNVPCVVYGGKENIHFQSHENSFTKLIYTPEIHLVKLNVDGKEYEAVLKDIQFNPVTDKIEHIDFVQVFNDVPVIINIPIKVTGESDGIKAGGKLRIRRRSLKSKGFALNLPEFLPVDITNVHINQSIKVGDLSFENIELLDPKRSMVLAVATSRVAQKTEETVEAVLAGESTEEVTEEK
jgi:large subunit ribosomal protein L25